MKKSEVITIRTDLETKEKLEKRADKYKWSLSQTTEQIVSNYFYEPNINESDNERQSEVYKIEKRNQETICRYAEEKNIDMNDAINNIIEYFAIQWPIGN